MGEVQRSELIGLQAELARAAPGAPQGEAAAEAAPGAPRNEAPGAAAMPLAEATRAAVRAHPFGGVAACLVAGVVAGALLRPARSQGQDLERGRG